MVFGESSKQTKEISQMTQGKGAGRTEQVRYFCVFWVFKLFLGFYVFRGNATHANKQDKGNKPGDARKWEGKDRTG